MPEGLLDRRRQVQIMLHLNGFDQVIHVNEITARFDYSFVIFISSTLLLHRQELCDGLDLANSQSTLERLIQLGSLKVSTGQMTQIYSFEHLHELGNAPVTLSWLHSRRWLHWWPLIVNEERIKASVLIILLSAHYIRVDCLHRIRCTFLVRQDAWKVLVRTFLRCRLAWRVLVHFWLKGCILFGEKVSFLHKLFAIDFKLGHLSL